MAAYESYKDSGVKWLGKIPSHWDTGKMREFFSERKQLSQDGSEMLLSVSEYSGVTPSVNEAGENVSRSASLIGYKKCKSTDLVINIMLAWKRGLGISDYKGIVSPAYCVFDTHNINPQYANYLLRTDLYTGEFKRNSTGIIESRLRMYPDDFKNILCIKPPKEEQEAIVAYLDRLTGNIERAIEAQKKMIDALSERKQIIITRAVIRGLNPGVSLRDSGIDWLGQIPKHWKVSQLRRIAAVKTGKTPPSSTPEYYENRDIIWYTPGDFPISSIYLGDSERKLDNRASKLITIYPANTVLLVGIGGTLGKVGFTEKSCFSNQQINAIIPALSFNGKFLAYYLTAIKDAIRNSANSATLPILNQNATKRLPIVVAPLNEQNCIVEAIEKGIAPLTDSIKHCERMISLLQERKQIIINEVVTGKKKVI